MHREAPARMATTIHLKNILMESYERVTKPEALEVLVVG
jgi:hypothetical protein